MKIFPRILKQNEDWDKNSIPFSQSVDYTENKKMANFLEEKWAKMSRNSQETESR